MGNGFPFAARIQHFTDEFADVARAFGVGFQAARDLGMFEGFFDTEKNRFGGEEAFLNANGFVEGVAGTLRGEGHQAEEGAPIHRAAAGKMAGPGIEQAQLIGGDEHEARFIQAAASGAAEHLQNFVGFQWLFLVIPAIGSAGERNAAQRKINPGGEAHGGHNDAQMSRLGQGFDDARARGEAQSTVMIGDAAFQQFGQMIARNQFLRGAELEGIGGGKIAGEFGGYGFSGLPARGEDEDGAEVFRQRFGAEARPVALNFAGHMEIEIVGLDFFERHGTMIVADKNCGAAQPMQPFDDVLRIGDAAAEEEELGVRRREGKGEFVIEAAVGVADHLIFINDEERRAIALDEAGFLGFESGDKDGRLEIFGKIARGDAHIPAARAPFREFVVGQRAGGDGVDGVAAVFAGIGPKLEDQRFARASGGLDYKVLARAQSGYGLLLPEVGNGDLVERGVIFKWFGERHEKNITDL